MNYPYAVGSIKVIEANILDRNKLAKLYKLESQEFIKTLVELGYGNTNSKSLEDIIESEILETKATLDSLTPDKRHTDLFYFASDALNIKAMYKKKIFGLNNDIFVKTGVMEKDLLEKVIFHDDFSGLNKELKILFKRINETILGVTSPRLISAKIDQIIFNYILEVNRNTTLKTYFQAVVDFNNVITFIRSRNLNWSVDNFLEMYLLGGLIPQELFIKAYSVNKDVDYLFKDFYQEKISKGLKIYFDNENLDNLERYFDKLILMIMKEYRHDSFDIGPIIYYFLTKQAEAKNIRMLYANIDIDISDLLEY